MNPKRILGVLVLSAALTGCATQQAAKNGASEGCADPARLESLAKAWFDAFNRNDADAIQAFYADNAVAEDPETPQPKMGAQAVTQTYRDLFSMAPGVVDNIKSIHTACNKVFVEFESVGRIQNVPPEAPEQMKDKDFVLKIMSVMEYKDDKIVRDASYYDVASFMKQVGLM